MGPAPTASDAAALAAAGQWASARSAYAAVLAREDSGDAHRGLAHACWWLGEPRTAVRHAELAFAAYAAEERDADAAMIGIHLCIWYLTNFDNPAAAAGWLSRSRRLAERCGDAVVDGWVTLIAGYLAEDPEDGRRLIESAASTATSLSNPGLATMALADLGLWHVTVGDVSSGMAMLDEAMAATFAEPHDSLEVVVWASCNMLAACSLVDDLRRATDWCRAADRFMETYGCPFLQARCRAHYGRVLVAAGRWGQAERELAQALAMSVDNGSGPRTEALTALAELRLHQGDAEAAIALLDEAGDTPLGAITRSRCLVALDRAVDARGTLRAALALADPEAPAYPSLVAALVEVELASGRLAQAVELVAPESAVWSTPAFPRAAGHLARAAGMVATVAGDPDGARRHLGFALDLFARLELPWESARTELALAALLRSSDPDAAAARARAAYIQFEALGARRDADEAAALLRSLGIGRPPGPRRADALTEREQEVLGLLQLGLSNPQIAERLFLSPRTVAHHVSSVLRKLGVRTRAEAAAYAAREAAMGQAVDRSGAQASS